MNRFIIALLALVPAVPLLAQEKPRTIFSITTPEETPLVLVDSLPAALNALLLSADKIERMDIFKGPEAQARYGDKGKNGVILIHTKPNTSLLRLAEIFDQFHISPSDRQLRVCINDLLITDPKLIVAGVGDIESVEVVKGRRTETLTEADTNERFLNIKALAAIKK
jgi:TonB-dependent SusC/RagA subfamily outer membrane receptor